MRCVIWGTKLVNFGSLHFLICEMEIAISASYGEGWKDLSVLHNTGE